MRSGSWPLADVLRAAGPATVDGLLQPDFRPVADEGFGDGLNAYAHTMTWFGEHLYVGTTRANLCMVRTNNPIDLRHWPVRCPDDIYDLDRRAQIWRYDHRLDEWENVLTSPMVTGPDGTEVARDVGYRGMAVFQGRSDPTPALYVYTWAPSRSGRPPVILRSYDGRDFVEMPVAMDDPSLNTCRILVSSGDDLFTSPTGRTLGWNKEEYLGATVNMSGAAMVLRCSDPSKEPWVPVSPLGFEDPSNTSIFEMAVFNGYLYAGTLNPTGGFQVWKARATTPNPTWTEVITAGAGRGDLNQAVVSMAVFDGALYVGTGIQNGGYDRTHDVGPAAAELIRIHPDDSWDLLVGEERSTPDGYKYPLSGLGPGFDDLFNGYLWRMAAHDGTLYVSTYNWRVFLRYLPLDRWPSDIRARVEDAGIENLIRRRGGFDLWSSSNGIDWSPVTRNGFNNEYNYGARTLASSPVGLFVGTANPFGPDVAVETLGGWKYVENPKGGLEVWLGRSRDLDAPTERANVVSGQKIGAGPRGAVGDNVRNRYQRQMYGALQDEFYEGSDFHNFGYWSPLAQTPVQACTNLVELLLDRLPSLDGPILDVACGKGATTRTLLQYFSPEAVTGVDLTAPLLATARSNAPGCTFREMSATDLRFPDNTFQSVISVEAAFHFETREQFFREAHRVLKPGGHLVLSDILFKTREIEARNAYTTAANFVPSIAEYEELCRRVGFEDVRLTDATTETIDAWRDYAEDFVLRRHGLDSGERRRVKEFFDRLFWRHRHVSNYLLVALRKPSSP